MSGSRPKVKTLFSFISVDAFHFTQRMKDERDESDNKTIPTLMEMGGKHKNSVQKKRYLSSSRIRKPSLVRLKACCQLGEVGTAFTKRISISIEPTWKIIWSVIFGLRVDNWLDNVPKVGCPVHGRRESKQTCTRLRRHEGVKLISRLG